MNSIQDKKGEDIVVLNLENIPDTVSSRFIICQADSTTQVRAIANHVIDQIGEELGEVPYSKEGLAQCEWVLVDYIDVVVHIFIRDKRQFYQLEDLWHDAAIERIPNFN
ncbi:MAG: ribosome silencing factor [Chitinophagales bacterium]|nr:ribosome silencing factor [Chitinophagales bacterium]MCB9022514.1 ribosome silencing factor [Chitinophagales bacterium]MCB9032152.1 ribosome silencing factor [Chitinophagales bacterium]